MYVSKASKSSLSIQLSITIGCGFCLQGSSSVDCRSTAAVPDSEEDTTTVKSSRCNFVRFRPSARMNVVAEQCFSLSLLHFINRIRHQNNCIAFKPCRYGWRNVSRLGVKSVKTGLCSCFLQTTSKICADTNALTLESQLNSSSDVMYGVMTF